MRTYEHPDMEIDMQDIHRNLTWLCFTLTMGAWCLQALGVTTDSSELFSYLIVLFLLSHALWVHTHQSSFVYTVATGISVGTLLTMNTALLTNNAAHMVLFHTTQCIAQGILLYKIKKKIKRPQFFGALLLFLLACSGFFTQPTNLASPSMLGFMGLWGVGTWSVVKKINHDTPSQNIITATPIIRLGDKDTIEMHWYYRLMQSSWLELFLWLGLGYFVLCMLFAVLYMMAPEALNQKISFVDAVAFSIQTFTTIGYGALYPQNGVAHSLVFVESFVGLAYVALMTGLVFSKASHPIAKILFSQQILFLQHQKKPTISFRIANAQGASIVEAQVSLFILKRETLDDGSTMNKIYDLKLERSHSPLFALSWNVFHQIDESSPLYGYSREDISNEVLAFIVTVRGYEELYRQDIYVRYRYGTDNIEWDRKFLDVIGSNEAGHIVLNLKNFHSTTPCTPPIWTKEAP